MNHQKRPPKADKEQRRHLLLRIDRQTEKLERQLRKRERRGGWDDSADVPEPPEVVEARKVIEAYEDAEQAAWDLKLDQIKRLRDWLREQVLFSITETALAFTKRYEILSVNDAMEAGKTMEDRNDAPLLNFQTEIAHAERDRANKEQP